MRHDRRGRIVLPREREDVAHARRAEAVDRLRVVAHDGDAAAVGLHQAQDLRLQRVGVLVFVDQHVIEAARRCAAPPTRRSSGGTSRAADRRSRARRAPPSRRRSAANSARSGSSHSRHQGKRVSQAGAQRLLRVDDAGIDREAGPLAREAPVGAREAALVAQAIEQIGGVLAIEQRERRVQSDLGARACRSRRFAIAWNVPAHGSAASSPCGRRAQQPQRPPGHLLRRPPRERQQQDPPRVGAARDQRRHPVRQRLRLARCPRPRRSAAGDRRRPRRAAGPGSAWPRSDWPDGRDWTAVDRRCGVCTAPAYTNVQVSQIYDSEPTCRVDSKTCQPFELEMTL